MLSTQRLGIAWIGALLALAATPAWAALPFVGGAGSRSAWGYHPPAGESARYPDVCSLDAPYDEPPFIADANTGMSCPDPATESPRCTGPFCPANGVCEGTVALHEDLNACQGGDCCVPGSVSMGSVVNVVPYLERPAEWPFSADPAVDHSTNVDDSPGIARAIECAASLSYYRRTVAFPAGRYVLRTPLRPEHDALTLEGPELSPDTRPGDPETATLVAIPCNPEQLPGAIQVHKAAWGGQQPDQVWGLWIRNLQIQLTEGPRKKANSGIQLNNCADCEVENVIMRYAPLSPQLPSCKPANLDGIGFAVGSGGVIRNVIVDGTPKGGIYLASVPGYHDTPPILVENCEIKNIDGPVGAIAIKIITANVTVRNCEVHHSIIHPGDGSTATQGGHGLRVATQARVAPGMPSAVPANVLVQDSYFHHNAGTGVAVASVVENERPTGIRIERVRTAYNGSYGVNVQAGAGVQLRDLWSWGNGFYGIYISSGTSLPASSIRVGSVILERPLVFNNSLRATSGSHPGIKIDASNVTIYGGEVARCDASRGRQSSAIQQQCWLSGPTGGQVLFRPENNVIWGAGVRGTSAPEMLACPHE
ncbi:right-handed parallel beta-helix repeat-containing protein [Sorangium sp. So ce1335]|uniref:right-handed parallel beta-helix repeat-containing protein n=1 Tax=Sorangium sp. So ce1335 TaxID=3133335 RepID=UPI003F606144